MSNRGLTDDLAASLVAAVSVIKTAEELGKSPSHAWPSKKMHQIAVSDYEASIERYRDERRLEKSRRFPQHDPSVGIERQDFIKYVAVQWPEIPHPPGSNRSLVIYGPQTFRHHHILLFAEQVGFPRPKPENQGFSLEWGGPFMDRREAAEYALRIGQVTRLGAPPDLYSEDLW